MSRRFPVSPALSGALAVLAPGLSAGCDGATSRPNAGIELRDGLAVAKPTPTPLYSPKFVIRAMAADGDSLYVSGLRFAEPSESEPGGDTDSDVPEAAPTGVIVKIPLLGVPETLAEGAFLPMTRLELVGDHLYWHERHDSPDGPGLRALSLDGASLERVSEFAGHSWIVRPNVVYFTRPDDEIDEGGFYVLDRSEDKPPRLVARRRGVVRTLLSGDQQAGDQQAGDGDALYWTTRARRNGTWGVYEWDGAKSGTELLRSDETFASLSIDHDDFLWVTWAEADGAAQHSVYRRPIAGGDTEVLARRQGMPGFMEVFSDDRHVYLTTVRGGELRRLAKTGGEVEVLAGSGDREVVSNRFNLFWVDDRRVFWMAK